MSCALQLLYLLLTKDVPSWAAVGGCPAAAAPVAGYAFRLIGIDIKLADPQGSECAYDFAMSGTYSVPQFVLETFLPLVCPRKEATITSIISYDSLRKTGFDHFTLG